jgi:hypothetical protein
MPRDSARAPQLSLFVSDPAASPEALTRYEAPSPSADGSAVPPPPESTDRDQLLATVA